VSSHSSHLSYFHFSSFQLFVSKLISEQLRLTCGDELSNYRQIETPRRKEKRKHERDNATAARSTASPSSVKERMDASKPVMGSLKVMSMRTTAALF